MGLFFGWKYHFLCLVCEEGRGDGKSYPCLTGGSNFDVTGISIMSGLVCEGPGVMAALASVPGSESAFGGHHDKRPNQPMLLGHNHIKHQAFWVPYNLYNLH